MSLSLRSSTHASYWKDTGMTLPLKHLAPAKLDEAVARFNSFGVTGSVTAGEQAIANAPRVIH